MTTLSKTQAKFVEILRTAGALDTPVDWRALKVNENTLKSLITRGIVIPPEGDKFGMRSGYCYGNGPQATKTVRLSAEALGAVKDAPKKPAKQTCPCCFRAMTIKNGAVVRHGWQESGGRRQGEYGNVWQMGSCFGVGYKPYEVSTEGTVAFLAHLSALRPNEQKTLDRLIARPATLKVSWRGVGESGRYETLTGTVEDNGEALDSYQGYNGHSKPSYVTALNNYIYQQERTLKELDMDIATLQRMIKEWKAPAAPKKAAPKKVAKTSAPKTDTWDSLNGVQKFEQLSAAAASAGKALTFDGAAYILSTGSKKVRIPTLDEVRALLTRKAA